MDIKMIGLLIFVALFIGFVVVMTIIPTKKHEALPKPGGDSHRPDA